MAPAAAAVVTTKGQRTMAQKVTAATAMLKVARRLLQANDQERLEARFIQAFFEIASQESISYGELAKRLQPINQPDVSRYVQRFGPGRFEDPGMGLIEEWRDPQDQRVKYCKLNARGRKVLDQIIGAFE